MLPQKKNKYLYSNFKDYLQHISSIKKRGVFFRRVRQTCPHIMRFVAGDPDSHIAWIENLCGSEDFPISIEWHTLKRIGRGTFGVVYACTIKGMENRCAVKVMLNVEEGDWSRVNRPRENEVVDFLKTKKLPKKYMDAKWAEECYELLSEIEYATYMGRENIGPKVYGRYPLKRNPSRWLPDAYSWNC